MSNEDYIPVEYMEHRQQKRHPDCLRGAEKKSHEAPLQAVVAPSRCDADGHEYRRNYIDDQVCARD